jgi:4-alpha-methyl-delta7-sterol-4alpha-methyl oxidase
MAAVVAGSQHTPTLLHKAVGAAQWAAFFFGVPAALHAMWPQLVRLCGGTSFGAMVWGTLVLHVAVWLVVNTYYAAIYYWRPRAIERYKIASRPWPWHGEPADAAAFWARTRRTVAQIVFNNLVLSLPLAAASASLNKQHNSIALEDWPSTATFVWQIALFTVVEDTVFYWSHRTLHTPWLYRKVHAQHHAYKDTVSWAAEDAAPLEFVLGNLLPFIAGPQLVRPHMAVMYAWLLLRIWATHEGHSGYCHPTSIWLVLPFAGRGRDHELHHAKVRGNYGSSFAFWDRWMGTEIDATQLPPDYWHHPGDDGTAGHERKPISGGDAGGSTGAAAPGWRRSSRLQASAKRTK